MSTAELPRSAPGRTVRTRREGIALRIPLRPLAVGGALAVAIVAIGLGTLMAETYGASVGDVVATLLGDGPAGLDVIVFDFRLPRLLVAIAVGAALGVSGAIFQALSNNPLGSPDIVGFTTGSATGALLVILVIGPGTIGGGGGAVLGGLVTAAVVYVLAFRRDARGLRLILVGLGVSAMLAAVNAFLLSRAALGAGQDAQLWLVGSLNARNWEHVAIAWGGLALALPLAFAFGRHLAMLEMGELAAMARGVAVERTRVVLVVIAVVLAAAATAVAGPVGFVALAAPQVARRLTRTAGTGLATSALTGGMLLSGADLAGQYALAPRQLPVGLTTAAIGGLYLMWLLASEWRRGR